MYWLYAVKMTVLQILYRMRPGGPEGLIRYNICKTVIFQAYNLRKTLKTTNKAIIIITLTLTQ